MGRNRSGRSGCMREYGQTQITLGKMGEQHEISMEQFDYLLSLIL